MVAKKSSPAFSEQLNVARKKRNEQQSKLEALVMARELIMNAIPEVYYGLKYI